MFNFDCSGYAIAHEKPRTSDHSHVLFTRQAARAVVLAAHAGGVPSAPSHTNQQALPWNEVVFVVMEVSLSGIEISSAKYLRAGSFSGDLYAFCRTELETLIEVTAPDATSADYAISVLVRVVPYMKRHDYDDPSS